ncbi:MAG: PIG-L deacetylase family protein [Planctomycetota bacterium]
MSPYYRKWENLYAPADLVQGPLLYLSPHPDDEVLGGGGLILAHRDVGERVLTVVMTDGGKGDATGKYGTDYPEIRKAEFRAAALALGDTGTRFLDFPDFGLAELMAHENPAPVAAIEEILGSAEWGSLAFPSPWELHPDHRATCLAALRAVLGQKSRPRLLAYEVGSFMPNNLLLDISGLFERKLKALRCYASQLEHHDLVGKMTGLDVARTANVDDKNISHCEAWLRVADDRIEEFLNVTETAMRVTDEMGPAVPYL